MFSFKFSIFTLLFLLAQSLLVSGAPAEAHNRPKCRHPVVRKEWRTLSKPERLHYISSVQCLLRKPAKTPKSAAPGVVSRFDDFVATHINQTTSIHFVGQFLPWHRLFTAKFEIALREECGYRGAQPYWDWTLDNTVPKFLSSPVFDAKYGFGGNGPLIPVNESDPSEVPGRTGGGCIKDGPFKDMKTHLGPGMAPEALKRNDRCLMRDFAPTYATKYLAMNKLQEVITQPDFGRFTSRMEGGANWDESMIHDGGHYGVGGSYGQMADPFASPADPIFYLHHANLDRVWWSWQKKDAAKRLKDVSGPLFIKDFNNEKGGNTTLDYQIDLGFNSWNAKVADVMDIKGGVLCFDYDRLY